MSEGVSHQAQAFISPAARAALVAKALSEAAQRARFSTKRRRGRAAIGFRIGEASQFLTQAHRLAFVCLVVLPTATASLYYGLWASNQYVAEARFTVRGGLPPSIDRIGAMTGAPSSLIIQDTQVIINYLQSRSVVELLDRGGVLQDIYGRNDIDWFSRLKHGRPIERIVKYWNSRIDLSVQMPSGIVVFTVRAFAPNDAAILANAALDGSERLVNRMNDQMRRDAVALAEAERQRAQDTLVKMRASLERIRNEEGILNADVAARSLTDLITRVRGELIAMQQQYESQRRFVNADAPQMKTLKVRIAVAVQAVARLESQLTIAQTRPNGDHVISASVSRLDDANLETTIAEKYYAGTLAALEHARLASETKLMYINTFVQPVAADEAKYPKRIFIIALVALIGFVAWSAAAGLLVLVRNRMG